METILATTGIEFINWGIKLNNIGKNFSVFGFEIAYYGIIIAAAILTGILIACIEAKRTGQNPDLYIDFALYVIIACIIGARLYYVAFEWDYYKSRPLEIVNLRGGGLAIYGAVIAAVITAFIYARIKKASFGKMADTAVLGLIAGQIIGRWGNFFNREAFGNVIDDSHFSAMRIYFDKNYSITQVPEAVKQAMESMTGKNLSQIGYIQVQPTFLYESCWNLGLLILIVIFKKYKKFDGEVLMWYLIGYGAGRFMIEGMRTDQLIISVTGWPVSQALSLVFVAAAIAVVVAKRMKVRKAQ